MRILQCLLVLAYPLCVYAASSRFETRALGWLLLGLLVAGLALRVRIGVGEIRPLVIQHAGIALLVAASIAADSQIVLLLLPALVSLYLLGTFGASLRRGPPMIERFARALDGDDFPEPLVGYCRTVTAVWCAFFAGNALVVALLAFAAPLAWWAIYTGGIFYGLLGALFAAELAVRKWRLARIVTEG